MALHYAITGNDIDTLDQGRLDCAKVLAEEEAEARKARGEKHDLYTVHELTQKELHEKGEKRSTLRRGTSKSNLG